MKHKRPTVFIAATVLLLAAVVVYILVTLNTPVPTPVVELPDRSQTVSGPSDDARAQYAAVTPETVQAVIASMARPDGYSRTVTVEDFWDGGSAVTDLSVQVSGASTKVTAASPTGLKYILTTETGTWVWYDGDDQAFFSEASAPHDGDQWQRMLTYEDLLRLSPEDITDAGYEEHGGVWCVFAGYDTPNFGYHTTLWVSAADGLLAAAEVRDGETLLYRMTGGAVDTSIPDDSVFLPPATDAAPASAYRFSTANTR